MSNIILYEKVHAKKIGDWPPHYVENTKEWINYTFDGTIDIVYISNLQSQLQAGSESFTRISINKLLVLCYMFLLRTGFYQ